VQQLLVCVKHQQEFKVETSNRLPTDTPRNRITRHVSLDFELRPLDFSALYRMADHKAIISWKRTSPDFLKGKYSREHTWTFDGGLTISASPSPSVVPAPYSNPAYVDPDEAFVAAVSSCHMLTYWYLASKHGFQVDSLSR